MGTAEHGLPVGLQIVGRRFEDALVLRAPAAWERPARMGPGLASNRAPPIPRAGVFAELASGARSVRLSPEDSDVAAGERIQSGSDVAEIRRVLNPRDGELVVELDL